MSEKLVISRKTLNLNVLSTFKNKKNTKVYFICEDCGKESSKSIAQFIKVHDFKCHSCHLKSVYSSKSDEEKLAIQKSKENGVLKKYGCKNPFQAKEVKDKICQTNLERYGYENVNKVPEVRQKIKETCLKKYGVENPNQRESEKERLSKNGKNLYKKYLEWCESLGITNVSQLPEHKKIMQDYFSTHHLHNNGGTHVLDGIHFDSSWEVAFYIYLKDHNYNFTYQPCKIKYFKDGVSHNYYVDFQVNNQLIEIKGGQFFNEKGEPQYQRTGEFWWEKYYAMVNNNVLILGKNEIRHCIDYVKETYGKDFIKSLSK